MPENTITIPVGDWVEEYQQEEPNVSTEDATIETQMERGYGPQKLGRLCVIGQQRGEASHFSAPKVLLQTGAARAVSDMIVRRKREVNIRGHKHTMREFVAPVHTDGYEEEGGSTLQVNDDDPAVVRSISEKALERAEKYLRMKVPGYIQSRLIIVAANGGNVEAAADRLKVRIDELVATLA
jgi:hypothetical protein